jgi:hypothetical protein
VLAEPLRSLLAQVADAISRAAADISGSAAAETPAILAGHRATVYAAMDALGSGILDFLAEDPPRAQVQATRELIVHTLLEWSRTSPLIRHSIGKSPGQSSDPELVKRLLGGRPAGADIASLILNDYYMYSVGGLAYRGRLGILIKAVQRAVSLRAAAGIDPVRILCLHVSGAEEILSMAQDETFAAVAEVTCIDDRPNALRDARRGLDGRLMRPASFMHAGALRYSERPDRPSRPYDIIYGVSIFEHLAANLAIHLAQDCYTLLAPDGVLLAGSVTVNVPVSEQVLRAWLTGWDLQYRDETMWRAVLARTGFDTERVRFEYEPRRANVLVSVERGGSAI